MATYYARAVGGNWTAAATWSLTSGGGATGSTPTLADEVIFDSNSGNVTVNTGSVCRSWTVNGYTGTITHTSGVTLSVGDATPGTGNMIINFATSGWTYTLGNASSSAISFTTTSATQQTITTSGKTFGSITFSGSGGNLILGGALTSTGNITLNESTFNTANYSMTYSAFSIGSGGTRTLTMGSSTCTATSSGMGYGNFGGCTITPNTAVITITATPTSQNNLFVLNSFNWQGMSFVINGGGQGTLNIANATIGDLTITGPANQNASYRVSGSFTCNTFTVNGNSNLNRPLLFRQVNGTAAVITASSTSISNADFMDITGAGAGAWTITSGLVGDWGGNTNIQTTTPATQTRDSTSGQAWSVVARWTSRVPLPQDNVLFNSSSGSVSATDVQILGKSLDFTGYTGTITHTSSGFNYTIFGDLILSSGMSFGAAVNTFNLDFRGRGSYVLTSNGKVGFPFSSNGVTTIAAPGGTYTLTDTYYQPPGLSVGNYTFSVTAGTFTSANQTMNIGKITSTGTVTRVINLGTSTLNLMATSATSLIALASTGLTFSGSNAIFNTVNASANARTIDLGGASIGTFSYTNAGSTGQLNFITSGTINTLNFSDATNARTIQLTAGITLTIATLFNVFGASGRLITIQTSSAGNIASISKPSNGTLWNSNVDWLSVKDIRIIQPLSGWVGANSTNVSGNINVIFSTPTGSYRHRQSIAATALAATVSATFPHATTPGNLLIAHVVSSGTPTGAPLATPAGFTLAIGSSTAAAPFINTYYKVADGTETTLTYTQTNATRTLIIELIEYSGFSGTPTLDVTDSNTGSGTSLSTTATTGPTNTAQPALALALLGANASMSGLLSATNSFALDFTPGNAASQAHAAAKELSTLAAVETTLTWTTSRTVGAQLVVFYAAATNWTKSLTDSSTPTDSIAKSIGKAFSEIPSISDAIAKLFGKKPSDSVATSDALTKAYSLLRTDQTTPIDSPSKVFSAVLQLADIAAVIDQLTYEKTSGPTYYQKAISDLIVLSDNIKLRLNSRRVWYQNDTPSWANRTTANWYEPDPKNWEQED